MHYNLATRTEGSFSILTFQTFTALVTQATLRGKSEYVERESLACETITALPCHYYRHSRTATVT